MGVDRKAPTKAKAEDKKQPKTKEEKQKTELVQSEPQTVRAKQAQEQLPSSSESDSDYQELSGDDESEGYESVSQSDDGESGNEGESSEGSELSDDESEDGEPLRHSEDGQSQSSGEEGHSDTDENDGSDNDEDLSENSESNNEVEESDSSEDEVAPRNTIGDVPLVWYKDEKHIGYDITGKKIKKKERQDKLDTFLASVDDSKNWRKIYDEYNDEEVELTKEETRLIRRLLKGQAPHAEFDQYAPYVDWFKWDDAKHPLSNAPEPKRRFIPSKWENKKVVAYVRAIRKGLIKFDKPEPKQRFGHLWEDDSAADRASHLSFIPAPKAKLPDHGESYNPPMEYVPTQEEINSYQLMFEEDRPKFIPKCYKSLRSIPAYDNALKEAFERCLDLYLCPRVRKKRIHVELEDLLPKLPSKKDLKPYPVACYLEYRGHEDSVVSISTDVSGQWIASGSTDGTVRIWEVETTRCLKVFEIGEPVLCVSWNPLSELPILAVSVGQDVLILNTGLGNEEQQRNIKELLHIEKATAPDDSGTTASIVTWLQEDELGGAIRIKHFKTVTSVEWHRKGDYFSATIPAGESKAIQIHQLSKKFSQVLQVKLRGLPVVSVFHPTQSIIFIATKKFVRLYHLVKRKTIKKLESGLREISSIAIHPEGDNVIVGSKEGKVCWFDLDLSAKPYRILKNHDKDISNVAFHPKFPLFSSCSDDCTAYVFHGRVFADLNTNPVIIPLEILRGHKSSNGRGVLNCKFHPKQPWLFTAGADSVIRLYCH